MLVTDLFTPDPKTLKLLGRCDQNSKAAIAESIKLSK